jgi:hypothetical protein
MVFNICNRDGEFIEITKIFQELLKEKFPAAQHPLQPAELTPESTVGEMHGSDDFRG